MLTAARALTRSSQESGREFPRIPEFYDLYQAGWTPRYGEMSMVSARSGSGKSTFGLYFAAMSGLSTLYFSGDMSAFQASVKLACAVRHETIDTVVDSMSNGKRDEILGSLPTNISFAFGEITKRNIDRHINAYVELNNEFPELIVIDNLMDMEGCESDYVAQSEAMQWLHVLNRDVGSAVWVLSHATDKGERGRSSPHEPPPRSEIKNGMSEKPETVLTLGLNPFTDELNIAIVKQRLGKSDPSGRQYVSVRSVSDQSRYERIGAPVSVEVTLNGSDKSSDQREEPASGSSVGDTDSQKPQGEGLRLRAPKALW